MPTHEAAIVAEARRIARVQSTITRTRRHLKELEAELKHAKKNLRALVQSTRDPFEQMPPLRVFGEKQTG